jgi:diguanylate cyclase (GGDEF)-like protein/PAS domain S-box-containing protein
MLGYTIEELKQLHIWDWEAVQSEEEIRRNFRDLSTVNFRLETRHRRKDGSIYDVELNGTGTSFTGKNGKYNVSMCICQDISARIMLEKQLKRSESMFRSFVEKSADIILTVNPDLDITYISPNCKGILGYEAEELIGKKMLSILLPEDRGIFLSAVQAGFEGSPDLPSDYRILHRNNRVEWYSMRFSESEDDNGEPLMICNVRNITQSKTYEEYLEYHNKHDPLTGIKNRQYFQDELIRQSRKNSYPISILSFDLDNFKETNDSYGHYAGDALLKDCAEIVARSMRKGDVFARMGGDEFAILFPSTTRVAAQAISKRMEENLAAYNETTSGPKLSISIGIATAENNSEPIERTLIESDRRMYIHKRKKKLLDSVP